MPNVKANADDLAKPMDEAYPDEGFTEVDGRVTSGLNPQNPGFPSEGYEGQGIAAPRYEEQRAMEYSEEE